jgi:hypothetical protein
VRSRKPVRQRKGNPTALVPGLAGPRTNPMMSE